MVTVWSLACVASSLVSGHPMRISSCFLSLSLSLSLSHTHTHTTLPLSSLRNLPSLLPTTSFLVPRPFRYRDDVAELLVQTYSRKLRGRALWNKVNFTYVGAGQRSGLDTEGCRGAHPTPSVAATSPWQPQCQNV